MYKHFQASSPKIICDKLNEHKMKIHSIEKTGGMIQCVAEPSDDKRKVNFLGGSVLAVTTNLNKFDREIEGKVLISGHSGIAFYRVDEDKEKKIASKMEAEKKKAQEAEAKAEKEAKKAEMERQMKELEEKMKQVDSEPSKAEKEKAEADKREEKRKEALKKAEDKKKKQEEERKKKEEEEKVKSESESEE